jgi:hypothetical protein
MDLEEQIHNASFEFPVVKEADICELVERVESGVRPVAILPINSVTRDMLRQALVGFRIVCDQVFVFRLNTTLNDFYNLQDVIIAYNNVVGSLRKRADYNCGFSLKKTIHTAFEVPLESFATNAVHGFIDECVLRLLFGHPLPEID